MTFFDIQTTFAVLAIALALSGCWSDDDDDPKLRPVSPESNFAIDGHAGSEYSLTGLREVLAKRSTDL